MSTLKAISDLEQSTRRLKYNRNKPSLYDKVQSYPKVLVPLLIAWTSLMLLTRMGWRGLIAVSIAIVIVTAYPLASLLVIGAIVAFVAYMAKRR